MPFDSLPTEHPHADELAILDRMAELLATPDRWCQGSLATTDGRICLAGAVWAVRHKSSHGVCNQVIVRLTQVSGPRYLTEFNDARERTHADILDLIARTRRTFEHDGSPQE